MKKINKVLIALGAGVAIGGLLGVLFAPGKGTKTRKIITDAGIKLTDSVKEKVNKGEEKLSELKERMNERIEAVKEKMQELV